MKKMTRIISVALLLCAALSLTGCGKDSSSAWLTDFTQAKEEAAAKNKNILLLFSGDDWDGTSGQLKESVLNTKEFISKAQKKYVLLNIDFSQEEYGKTDIAEEATDEEIAEAQRIQTLYIEKENIAEKYNLAQYPSLYVITPEEYALCYIDCDIEGETAESLLAKLEESEETQESISALIKALDGTEGLDRVRAIDELYMATDMSLRNPLASFSQEVIALDPANETGVIGKYEYELANQRAMDHAMYEGDVVAAAKEFEDVAANGHLSAAERQNAYYMSAYILAMSPEPDFEKMISLMQTSYEQDTQSELAPQILEIIENIRLVQAEQ